MSTHPLLAAGLETALRQHLELLPEAAQRLRSLAGKVIALELLWGEQRHPLYIVLTATYPQVIDEYHATPDLTLCGTPLAFTRLAQGQVQGSGVELRGDPALARVLQEALLAALDWQELLSQWLGDSLAYPLTYGLRHLFSWGQQLGQRVLRNSGDYLLYEAQTLPTSGALSVYSAAVDDLRDDVERLAARVARLQQHLGS